jgi:hypothetical protein
MALSHTVEQHAGEESEVYLVSPAVGPMQFLFRSNWSLFIAPYRSVLIDCDSGTFRVSFSTTDRNIWTNGSGFAVACVRPQYADLGYREFSADDFTGNKHQCPSAFHYGNG